MEVSYEPHDLFFRILTSISVMLKLTVFWFSVSQGVSLGDILLVPGCPQREGNHGWPSFKVGNWNRQGCCGRQCFHPYWKLNHAGIPVQDLVRYLLSCHFISIQWCIALCDSIECRIVEWTRLKYSPAVGSELTIFDCYSALLPTALPSLTLVIR